MFPLKTSDHVSRPYKITGKINVLYILTYSASENNNNNNNNNSFQTEQ
jgi:hypothetical protein